MQSMSKPALLVSALFLAFLAQAPKLLAAPAEPRLAGRWKAEVTAARAGVQGSYQVPFELLIEGQGKSLHAVLVNGSNRIDFASAEQSGSDLTLRLAQYDSTLVLHCSNAACERLEGEYTRPRPSGPVHYKVSAMPAPIEEPRQPTMTSYNLGGNWQFEFTDASGKPPASEAEAPAVFTQQGRHFEGTVAPLSGDYGLLSGEIAMEGGKAELHLSRFDGVHLLRLDGKVVSPYRIEGVFHEGVGAAMNFVAQRTEAEEGFAEAEHMTTVADPAEPLRFHGIDAAGREVTEADPRFQGKVVLVDIFGTWCPNCHDEASLLSALYSKYHERGLEIVGLSFEYVADHARTQRLIEVYRKKYNIGFPLLEVGTTDEGQVQKALPQLRNFGAFPTTIFLDRHGRVKVIHAGFSGPATGRLDELKAHFEREVEKMLEEK